MERSALFCIGSLEPYLPGNWNQRRATLAVSRFFLRVGLYQTLLENRTVCVGRFLAVENMESVLFLTGTVSDPRGFVLRRPDPAPPLCARVLV